MLIITKKIKNLLIPIILSVTVDVKAAASNMEITIENI